MINATQREKTANFLLIVGLGLILLAAFIPHLALADCSDWQHNYSTCLAQRPITDCACCIVSSPGGNLGQLCGDLSACTKPIGILVTQTGTNITDYNNVRPVVYSSPTQPSCDCCNVGILVEHENSVINHVLIDHVTVQNWATGILLYRLNRPGDVKNSNLIGNTNGIYLFNSGGANLSSNIIVNNDYGIILENAHAHDASDNLIYNNQFGNSIKNVDFVNTLPLNGWGNTWNTGSQLIEPPNANIIGGRYLGGNYWFDYSESSNCKQSCNNDGFCNPYQLNSDNVDNLPLCKKPFFDISVTGDVTFASMPVGESKDDTSVDMYIDTNMPFWRITAKDLEVKPALGHMVRYKNGVYGTTALKNPLQISAKEQSGEWPVYQDLSSSPDITIGSCPENTRCMSFYDIGIKQTIDYGDEKFSDGSVYRIVITFIGGLT